MEFCIIILPKVIERPVVLFARLLHEYNALIYIYIYEQVYVYNKCHTDFEEGEVAIA
jgi:hypothetical protein